MWQTFLLHFPIMGLDIANKDRATIGGLRFHNDENDNENDKEISSLSFKYVFVHKEVQISKR